GGYPNARRENRPCSWSHPTGAMLALREHVLPAHHACSRSASMAPQGRLTIEWHAVSALAKCRREGQNQPSPSRAWRELSSKDSLLSLLGDRSWHTTRSNSK